MPERLQDAPRLGTSLAFSAEQWCQNIALACEPPEALGCPSGHWTLRELADEAIRTTLYTQAPALSKSLVCFVAEHDGLEEERGQKGKHGVLKSMAARAAFLSDPKHMTVFYYALKYALWMNQIELWFGILVCKLLKRGNFSSVEDLQARVLAFIQYFNATMAKPFKWTYEQKLLCI